jgi:hypothetical protein
MHKGTKFREHIHGALSTSLHTAHRDEQATRHFLTKSHPPSWRSRHITLDGSGNAAVT